jgi:hypothetical protein
MSEQVVIDGEQERHPGGVMVLINDGEYHFEAMVVRGRELQDRADIPLETELFRQGSDGDQLIANDEEVHLRDRERFYSHCPVEVVINDKRYRFENDRVSGRLIKQKAGIPLNYSLYRRRPGENEPIGNDEEVHLHEDEHFFSRPPSNVS